MIQVLGDKVAVKMIKLKDQKHGDLFIPSKYEEKVYQGEITSVGKKCSPAYKVGQKVLLPNFGGDDIEYENEKYKIIRAAELLGFWSSEENGANNED